MQDLISLDSLSRALAERLLEQYPEWEGFVEFEGTGEQDRSIVFEVPQPETGRSLWIGTEDGEVTIAFAGWHTHESPWLEDIAEEAEANIVQRSLELVRQIVHDEVVVVFETSGGQWTGCSLQASGEDVPLKSSTTINVYSWHGTRDRVLRCED